jgi:hypothetical protein
MLENMLLNNPDITGNKKCVVSRVKKGSWHTNLSTDNHMQIFLGKVTYLISET